MTAAVPTNILHIDSSMRRNGSVSRALSGRIVAGLAARAPGAQIIRRDLADGVPMVDAAWIDANFTDPVARGPAKRAALGASDALVAELRAADTIVIGLPVYNFGVPAAFKAWVDQIARARETFRYTESGPVGLLTGKRAIVVVASGGTRVGSEIDFATPYARHMLGFVGITDVEIVDAGQVGTQSAAVLARAEAQADRLAA